MKLLDTSIAKEGPPASYILTALYVNFYNGILFPVLWRAVEHFALWASYETAAPELYAVCLSAGVWLVSYPVYGNDRQPVGYGMTTLYYGPGLTLTFLFFGVVTALVPNSRGVN